MFSAPNRLHPAAIVIGFGTYLVRTVKSLVLPLAVVFFANRRSNAALEEVMIGGVAALVGLLVLLGPIIEYFTTTYFIEDEAFVINRGFIWHSHRTIPLARIQNVNIERTIWHRMLNAAAIKVETASGHHGEGRLSALSLQNANDLQAALLRRGQAESAGSEAVKPEPLYKLSLRQVLLAGALENRLFYLIGAIAGVFQVDHGRELIEPLMRLARHHDHNVVILIGWLVALGAILLGWLISIVLTATLFYGFRIERHEKGLLLTHGLLTEFRSIVPLGRIQDVRIVEPFMFRILSYCEVFADTAGTFNKRDVASANKICPIVPVEEVDGLGRLLLPEFEFTDLRWSPVSPWAIPRRAIGLYVSWMFLCCAALGFLLRWNVLWAAIPLAPLCSLAGYLHYRLVGYAFTDDLVAARHGVLRRTSTLAAFDRIQHYTVRSTPLQRKLGLASVSAVTAATGPHVIAIHDVKAHAADGIRETLRSSIQRHMGSRRGGL